MVVRVTVLVFTFLVSHQFQCPVSNHFIDIHIGRSTCTSLDQIDRELIMEFASDNFFTSPGNCIGNIVRKDFQFLVCLCSSPFHHSQCFHIIRIVSDGDPTDILEILDSPKSLYTIVRICRHFFFA